MKKFNRKFFVKAVSLVMATTMIVAVFAGCGNKVSDKDEQGRTIVTIGGWPDKEGTALDNYNARKSEFEKNNPDVVIKPDYWKFDLKSFYAKAAGGQLPITYDIPYTEIPQIIDSGYAADLSQVYKKRGYDGMFNERVLEIISDDKGVYAFPFGAYILGLAYNTDLFEKAGLMEPDGTPMQPKNWDEVAEFAVKIKEATGVPGLVINTANNAGGWIFTNIAWSFGTDFMEQTEDGKWKATFNTPECAAALQWVKDLKWKYDVLPANTLIDNGEAQKIMGTEKAAMYVTAGDIPARLAKYGIKPDHIGMMALPAGPARHVALLGGSIFAVSSVATDDQKDAAVRWFESAYSHKASDEFKANKEREIQAKLEAGQLIGVKGMSVWSSKSEGFRYESELIDKYANSNPNHVRLYNEFVANCPAEIQPEEPVCAQELYQTLDGCIQEVLVNKDADPASLLEKANADFQTNYLDALTF